MGARALHGPKLIWFGGGGGGVNLLVQIISTCRHGLRGGGGLAGQHPVGGPSVKISTSHEGR
jgi:hypothetical protein